MEPLHRHRNATHAARRISLSTERGPSDITRFAQQSFRSLALSLERPAKRRADCRTRRRVMGSKDQERHHAEGEGHVPKPALAA